MLAPSAAELLAVWESGLAQNTARRALLLLELACRDRPAGDLAQFSIGQRNTCLLDLRESVFGSRLTGVAVCPGCGEQLQAAFDVSDVRDVERDSDSPTRRDAVALSIGLAGYDVHFRLPTSLDIAAIADAPTTDIATARLALLDRCVSLATQNGEIVAARQLPEEIVTAVAARMAEVDLQSDVQLAMVCPACGREWQAVFDIASFLWIEIDAWAARVVGEVHALASAYGWREADILAMHPGRRQMYLDLIGQS